MKSEFMDKRKAFDQAARYLSLQARCETQVWKYLQGKGYNDEEIREAMVSLREYGYVNDYTYVQAYYRQAAAKSKGRRRIETELLNKGVSRQVVTGAIEELLEEADEDLLLADERGRALEVGRKMARQQQLDGKPLDHRFSARVGRRLASLGYTADTIYYVLRKFQP
jgi:regulatory protein